MIRWGDDHTEDQEQEPLDRYKDVDEAWNIKAKFAYDLLDQFNKAWDLLEIADRKPTKTPQAGRFILNRVYRPLKPYLMKDENTEIHNNLQSGDQTQITTALDTLWDIFSVDLGHIIPKKKDKKLDITTRYKSIRMRRSEEIKRRAGTTD